MAKREPTEGFEPTTRCSQILKQLFAYVRQRPFRTQVAMVNGSCVRRWPPMTAPNGVALPACGLEDRLDLRQEIAQQLRLAPSADELRTQPVAWR